MRELWVYSNSLFGSLPQFTNTLIMRELHLSSNRFSGTIPSFEKLTMLSELWLWSNTLSGSIPEFQTLSNLNTLYISGNYLGGTFPLFANNPRLEYVIASGNYLGSQLPSEWPATRLVSLDISNNIMFGTIPDMKGLTSLVTLRVNTNYLDGSLPAFSALPRIQEISIYGNQLTGTIPDFDLSTLEILDLSSNQLTGTIPPLSRLSKIVELNTQNNKLAGSIPATFQGLTSLENLDLSRNQLSGNIPPYFWNLRNLVTVDLSNNQFQSDIRNFLFPSRDVSLSYNLRNIYIRGNQITGFLDLLAYYSLDKVEILDISSNQISGVDPLPYVLEWKYLNISDNPIYGPISETFDLFTKMLTFDMHATKMKAIGNGPILPSFFRVTNTFQLASDQDLFICPDIVGVDRFTNVIMDPSYYHYNFCRCLPNYYGFSNQCLECPEGCTCRQGIALSNCIATPSREDAVELVKCPYPAACNPDGLEEFSCAPGYRDHLCSRCEDGYATQGRKCIKCPKYMTYILVVTLPILFALLLWHLWTASAHATGIVKIFVFHLQTLVILSTPLLKYENAQQLIDFTTSISSVNLPGYECIFEASELYMTLTYSFMRIPIIIILMVVLLRVLKDEEKRDKVIFLGLFLFQMLYFSITREVFNTLGCSLYDQGLSQWYLNSYPWIRCDPMSSEYRPLLGLSIPVLFLYVLAFPGVLFYVLHYSKTYIDCKATKRRYGHLYMCYKPKLHYWELVVISRRLLFSLIYSVVPYTSESLLFVLLFLILQASLWLQHRYRPFSSPLENWLEMMSLNVIYVSFFGGLLSTFLQVGGWLPSLIILMNSIVVGIYSVIIIVTTRYFRRGFRSVWYQLLALDITAKKDPLLPRDPTHDSVDFSDAPVELYIAAEES
eukprot:TRINITY_DN6066_c0_g1_i6.p1 TRINITY_DN6066_c0_g1~~TRINITY_DN6066_c0_g1_i6.p1  ORF type:complete len:892 (+),score=118.05 TRINITY_DN6066_c0_g1_i6:899-3574(+)